MTGAATGGALALRIFAPGGAARLRASPLRAHATGHQVFERRNITGARAVPGARSCGFGSMAIGAGVALWLISTLALSVGAITTFARVGLGAARMRNEHDLDLFRPECPRPFRYGDTALVSVL
jgi:hypothetical protein